jgi:hypothetical protein
MQHRKKTLCWSWILVAALLIGGCGDTAESDLQAEVRLFSSIASTESWDAACGQAAAGCRSKGVGCLAHRVFCRANGAADPGNDDGIASTTAACTSKSQSGCGGAKKCDSKSKCKKVKQCTFKNKCKKVKQCTFKKQCKKVKQCTFKKQCKKNKCKKVKQCTFKKQCKKVKQCTTKYKCHKVKHCTFKNKCHCGCAVGDVMAKICALLEQACQQGMPAACAVHAALCGAADGGAGADTTGGTDAEGSPDTMSGMDSTVPGDSQPGPDTGEDPCIDDGYWICDAAPPDGF